MVFALPTCSSHDTVEIEAVSNRETHRSAVTGITTLSDYPGSHWEASITLHPKRHAEAQEWFAALIRGFTEPFYLSPPRTTAMLYETSNGVSPGTPRVNGADQTGTSLITDGWTANFIIKTGDYLELPAGGFSMLHKHIGADVTATGGAATLTLWPPMQRAAANDALIRVSAPRGEFILQKPRQSMSATRFGIYRQSFTAFQWLR